MSDSPAQLIVAVVPKDLVDTVVTAAMEAGATGATHWKGTGTGSEEVTFLDALFHFPPERDVVGVAVPGTIADEVFEAVSTHVPHHLPGIGFVMSIELARVVGIDNVPRHAAAH